MSTTKRKTTKHPKTSKLTSTSRTTASLTESASSFGDPAFFPFGRYTGIVGVHTSLLLYILLFLPRSTKGWLVDDETEMRIKFTSTSRDRPQHPFLEAITVDPAITVATVCVGVGVVQAWWGWFVRGWWVDFSVWGLGGAGGGDGRVEKWELERDKAVQLGKAWLFTMAASIPLHVFLVMLGAPVSTHIPQTYFLALLLSILILFTPAFVFGLPSLSSNTEALLIRLTWVRLFSEFSIRTPVERAILYPALGTVVGCWLGAIPIALDWDRPWQAWPLPPLFGAVLGYIVSSITALTVSAIKALADDHIRSLKAE
ncbi:hypothetical protein E1B28_006710 [Marasmius oreades]|uniref:Uncharacterized protein n=1 Tax=Marasmius oreades TaxID=181124 RepID=A0A9P8AAH8_9AGAR|nr:uncharacterized protein E1B28_006710 [Marasmius oreades]KAG7096029.1 hypothetical protein E1B28_006710 [Marasmius oreades]